MEKIGWGREKASQEMKMDGKRAERQPKY